MKIIFLDFDGVLNTIGQQRMNHGVCGMYLDGEKIKLLKALVDKTNAKVVLSTSWKIYWSKNISDCGEIGEHIHRRFAEQGIEIYDKTPHEQGLNRCQCIKKWLQSAAGITSYVVIDDLNLKDFFPLNSLQTSELVGITDADINRAAQILENIIPTDRVDIF